MDVNEGQSGQSLALRKQGEAFQASKRYEDALSCWKGVLSEEPRHPHALAGMAIALLHLDRRDEALAIVRQVTASPTYHPPSLRQLGLVLHEVSLNEEAVEVFRYAVAKLPSQPILWNHLGTAQLAAGRSAARHFGDALLNLGRAISLQPDAAGAHCNLALVLFELDRLPEAAAACRLALSIEPDSKAAKFNLSCILLAMGQFDEGWSHYRHRFCDAAVELFEGIPRWNGEPLEGRCIAVVGEQTNGDYLLFVRYCRELLSLGASVVMAAPRRLHRILSTLSDRIKLVDTGMELQKPDFQCMMGDLPHYLTSLGRPPTGPTRYLEAEPERIARWRDRIGTHGYRIGVAWEGGRYGGNDFGRSFPLEALSPLARIPGVRLISLQYRSGLDQIENLPPGMMVEVLGDDFESEEHGFLDAAAVMCCCDLVITLDSALAHLSGALGRRTWIALPIGAEWRWQRGRSDSPLYPTATLFRQHWQGEWDGVFTRMAEALRGEMSGTASPVRARTSRVNPLAPASCGEILDKITILEIKARRLASPQAREDVRRELHALRGVADGFGGLRPEVRPEMDRLRAVNERLWDVEDDLRACEAEGRFGDDFVALARSVYVLNDERAAIKRAINAAMDSELVEHKSYAAAPARFPAPARAPSVHAVPVAAREGEAAHMLDLVVDGDPDRTAADLRPASAE